MDEPLSNLDAQLRYYMRLEIKRICKEFGLTTIYVTHDQKEALSMSDRMAVLNEGNIVQIGTPLEVYKRPHSQFVADFIGVTNILEGTILRCGAGEAVIDTHIGQFFGVLANPNNEPTVGAKVKLSIRPEVFKLSDVPVEENCLAGSIGRATYYGEVAHYRFLTGGHRLKISELNPTHLGESQRDNLYAWVDAEDVVVLDEY